MSIEAIGSFGSVDNDKSPFHVDLDIINQGAWLGGSLSVEQDHTSVEQDHTINPSGLRVDNYFNAISEGLNKGFLEKNAKQLIDWLEDAGKPGGSDVTIGEMNAMLLNLSLSKYLADTASEVAKKTTEALQTLVVKQA